MFKDRLHKFTGELKEEARRIGSRFKEEFADTEVDKNRNNTDKPLN